MEPASAEASVVWSLQKSLPGGIYRDLSLRFLLRRPIVEQCPEHTERSEQESQKEPGDRGVTLLAGDGRGDEPHHHQREQDVLHES